jgi:hypothetical protein
MECLYTNRQLLGIVFELGLLGFQLGPLFDFSCLLEIQLFELFLLFLDLVG